MLNNEDEMKRLKFEVLLSAKNEIVKWAKINFFAITIIVGLIGYFFSEAYIHYSAQEQVRKVLKEHEIDDYIKEAILEKVGELPYEAEIGGLAGLTRKIRDEQRGLRKRLVEIPEPLKSHIQAYAGDTVTYDQLEYILSMDNRKKQMSAIKNLGFTDEKSLRQPGVMLVSPVSLIQNNPVTIFSDTVQLQWRDLRKPGLQNAYKVLWTFDERPGVDLPGRLEEKTWVSSSPTRQLVFDLSNNLKDKAWESASESLPTNSRYAHGRVYWQVVHDDNLMDSPGRAQRSNIAVFDFYQDALDRIQKTEQVRIGYFSGKFPDFVQWDREKEKLSGFDVELARKIVGVLEKMLYDKVSNQNFKLRPVFIGYDWDALLNAPRKHEVDFIISSITSRKEREERFGLKFSDRYYSTYQVFIWWEGSKNISDKIKSEEWQDMNFVVIKDTTHDALASEIVLQENIQRVEDPREALTLLKKGEADVFITDCPFGEHLKKTDTKWQQEKIVPKKMFPKLVGRIKEDNYAIAVAKTEEKSLLQKINGALEFLNDIEMRHLAKDFPIVEECGKLI